ncbi:two-component system response regulator [Patescibacteria group bacterium]
MSITSIHHKKTVLVVEDETPLLEALVDKFEMSGFKVYQAKNGKDGLEQALSHRPDMILLDIVMPVMDGLTMLEELRKNAWGKTAKVIMLTNLNDWDDTKQAVDQNVYEYLVKADWKIEDVVKKVKNKLDIN